LAKLLKAIIARELDKKKLKTNESCYDKSRIFSEFLKVKLYPFQDFLNNNFSIHDSVKEGAR